MTESVYQIRAARVAPEKQATNASLSAARFSIGVSTLETVVSYSDLLKDPRWQKRRLEIMQRADFACEYCGDKTRTLHVHHLRYTKGASPWEYEEKDLKCVCEICHTKWHMIHDFFESIMRVFSIDELEMMMGFGYGVITKHTSRPMTAATPHIGFGLLSAYGLVWEQCKDLIGPEKTTITGEELHARMMKIHGSRAE